MTQNLSEGHLQQTESKAALRRIKFLASSYVGLSLLNLIVIIALSGNAKLVNDAVWTRGIILALTSFLLLTFAVRLTRGSYKAYVRVRIVSTILLASVLILLAIPGLLPLWMKVEQGICGLILLGIVLIINSKHLRTIFAVRPSLKEQK